MIGETISLTIEYFLENNETHSKMESFVEKKMIKFIKDNVIYKFLFNFEKDSWFHSRTTAGGTISLRVLVNRKRGDFITKLLVVLNSIINKNKEVL